MDDEILKALLLPWWKVPVYVLAAAFAITTVKVAIKFDINTWLAAREKAKRQRDHQKQVEKCSHVWTLYENSQYSICNKCMVYIATSTLLVARYSDTPPTIAGEMHGAYLRPGEGSLFATHWVSGSQGNRWRWPWKS